MIKTRRLTCNEDGGKCCARCKYLIAKVYIKGGKREQHFTCRVDGERPDDDSAVTICICDKYKEV